MKKLILLIFLCLIVSFLFPLVVNAQFGKNRVVWEKRGMSFYQSAHFDFYCEVNFKNKGEAEKFYGIVNNLENSYECLSGNFNEITKKRVPVLVYRTHSTLESSGMGGGFLPEGVGAFAEPMRNRLVIKIDFIPPLNQTIVVHELAHIFSFDIAGLSVSETLLQKFNRPLWFMEGGAEYMASLCYPYTRDDIRGTKQRVIGANPAKYLPTWEELESGEGNPYIQGEMIFAFLEEKYGKEKAIQFFKEGLKNTKKSDLIQMLEEDISGGEIDSPEKFDRIQRDWWEKKFGKTAIDAPKPYQETESFKGEDITPKDITPKGSARSYPITSPVLSPDGKQIVCFTIENNGVSLVLIPSSVPKKENDKLNKNRKFGENRKPNARNKKSEPKNKNQEKEKKDQKKEKLIKNLTPHLPPYPWEYVVAQGLEMWTFNGFDVSWSRKNNQIAFFARKDRDHKLFIINPDGKILREIEIPQDQAFSPAWSPDGEKIYYSAAKDIIRDIYELNLKTGKIINLTDDSAYDTAPAVSWDGKLLVYVSFVGDFQKLFLLNLQNGEKNQLTYGRWNDDFPNWSDGGRYIIFTSDEVSCIWNIYTLELGTKKVSQWTNFWTGAYAPQFDRYRLDKIYFTAALQYDQHQGRIFSNTKLFSMELKKPIREYEIKSNENENYDFSFKKENIIKELPDENQVKNAKKPPKNWSVSGKKVIFGYQNFGGVYGYSQIIVHDLREEEYHFVQTAFMGDYFRLLNYTYLNLRNRLFWGYDVYDEKFPLSYFYFDWIKQTPDQLIFGYTMSERFGGKIFAQYPINKWKRLEFGVGAEKRIFSFDPSMENPTDPGYQFFKNSNGTSLIFSAAYVRDTVLYSEGAQGPFAGSALRFELNLAPEISKLSGYYGININARKYFRLGQRSVFALRGDIIWNSKPTGDMILLGGLDLVRSYPYGSIPGNQIGYFSAELRFPLVDAVLFPGRIAIGPFRGLIFANGGAARFSNEGSHFQTGASAGLGIEFGPFNFIWAKRIDKKDLVFDFYLGYRW